ncbi:MAG: cohesin domain-containing protein [Terriglobales bacterium]
MRRVGRCTAIVLAVVLVAASAMAESAGSLYKKGRNAEARQDYEAAYNYYRQAWEQKPKDLRYRAATARMRFQAGALHVHNGQKLRENGQLQEALAEFEKAAAIDPASFIAQQEIRRTRAMIDAAKSAAEGESVVQPQSMTQRRLEESPGPAELAPISTAPITLRLTEDSKVIYETIGKLAGINVLFDPDYTSRRIHIELNGVTLAEALELVAMQSKTFWRPVTSNTIFVAADTPAKRKELEQQVLRTFYLSNLSQPTELQDVVNTLRTVLEVSRLTQVPSQGAIVIRGTPDQVALAEKVIGDLDKAKSEVIIDVAVMQVSRQKIKNLGISPPTESTISLQPNVTTSGTTDTSSTSTGGINLNKLGNLTAKDFTVTIPSANIKLFFSDSDTRLIQNPQIRALDGQKATLKIGDRVPVATGSFQPGVGTIGINPLVNTQFQYLDVGVNIDITPKVHAGREVTLKLALDISAVTSRTNIGGIEQPVIGQRKIEHEIRLKDGEANLLGGILEEQDSKSLSGYPWISSVPILKYLFSQTNNDQRQNEIVFVLVPHVVRGQELTPLNLKPLEVGTGTTIELRHFNPPAPKPPTQPQAARPAAPQAAAPGTAQPVSQAQPAVSGAGGAVTPPGAVLSFNPPQVTTTAGQTFMVDLVVSNAQNLFSVPVQIQFDPTKLTLLNVSNGGFLAQGEQPVALAHREDAATGTMQATATRPPNSGGVSGQGPVLTLTFMAKASGQATISVTRAGLRDANNQNVSASGTQAVVEIKQ